MAISVVKAGLLDTIQDMGRPHYGNWGINPGGAMDPFAAKVANMLVGNCSTEAVLEMHFPGPQILFEQNALIAVTGGDFTPMLDDHPIPTWQPIVMRKNTVLHFPKAKKGARCYLSIHGGFCLQKWLGSYSTNTKAASGGLDGRPLRKNDNLTAKESTIYYPALLRPDKNLRVLPWRVDAEKTYCLPHEILVTRGHEWPYVTETSQREFFENNFTVHPSSDRMGYHLKGADVNTVRKFDLVSSAVSFGTVQLLRNGQLVILMADHQTTGGYPRIAHVISAHLPKLAQLQASDCLQFMMTDIVTAEKMLAEQEKELQILRRSCLDRLNEQICAAST